MDLPLQADGSVIFARWRQCAFPGGHIGATWQIRLNLCFLRPTQVHNPNGKSIGSAVIVQLKLRIVMEVSGAPSNTWFPGPSQILNPNVISISSAIFAQATAECPYTLQWDTPSPLKIAPFHGGSGPHLIHGSLGPRKFSTQMVSRSIQPFLQGSLV